MYQYLPNIFQNKTSEDNMYLAERIMYQIDDLLKEDMLNEYYYLPQKLYEDIQATTFDDLKAKRTRDGTSRRRNSEVIADNDTAREGDSTDDMTDMMTKKGKGSQNTLDHDEGGFIGQNQAFALEGINKM